MESKLLELARAVVAKEPRDNTYEYCDYCEYSQANPPALSHAPDCEWLQLKNEVERLDSQTNYTPQGESLQFAEPCKPLAYQA